MTPEDKYKQLRAFQARQCSALNEVFNGIEQLADAESAAATYMARAAKLMGMLRQAQRYTADDIGDVAKCFIEVALSDETLNEAVDPAGNAAQGSERVH
jgi:hypothetical protein